MRPPRRAKTPAPPLPRSPAPPPDACAVTACFVRGIKKRGVGGDVRARPSVAAVSRGAGEHAAVRGAERQQRLFDASGTLCRAASKSIVVVTLVCQITVPAAVDHEAQAQAGLQGARLGLPRGAGRSGGRGRGRRRRHPGRAALALGALAAVAAGTVGRAGGGCIRVAWHRNPEPSEPLTVPSLCRGRSTSRLHPVQAARGSLITML